MDLLTTSGADPPRFGRSADVMLTAVVVVVGYEEVRRVNRARRRYCFVVLRQYASKDLVLPLQCLHNPSCVLLTAIQFLRLLQGCIEEFRASFQDI